MPITSTWDVKIQESLPCEFDKIEFLNPKIVNENQMISQRIFGSHVPVWILKRLRVWTRVMLNIMLVQT